MGEYPPLKLCKAYTSYGGEVVALLVLIVGLLGIVSDELSKIGVDTDIMDTGRN